MKALTERRASSPASTGGAGTTFEQHVGAYWLAQLLVQGIPPILLDCSVIEVHMQTEHLGWHTDDLLIVGQNGAGTRRRLAGQVKRTFRISAADEQCIKATGDFWRDFTGAGGPFSSETDRFALVTLRGTNNLLEHFDGLLTCARRPVTVRSSRSDWRPRASSRRRPFTTVRSFVRSSALSKRETLRKQRSGPSCVVCTS